MLRKMLVAIVILASVGCTTQQRLEIETRLKPAQPISTTSTICHQGICHSQRWWDQLAAYLKAQQEAQTLAEFAAALHNHPFLVCTRAHESDTDGGYQAYNPSGPWYGAYQFTQGTWDSTAIHAGLTEYVGVNILQASEFTQDRMAYELYSWQGKAPWGGRC